MRPPSRRMLSNVAPGLTLFHTIPTTHALVSKMVKLQRRIERAGPLRGPLCRLQRPQQRDPSQPRGLQLDRLRQLQPRLQPVPISSQPKLRSNNAARRTS
jgi:hypothetical protein